jgi:DHA1 family multidrug resistance protein-like MFS transporter
MGSQTMIIPFLPLLLGEMGVREHAAISLWTGTIYCSTFLSAAIMAPVWGMVGDRYGQRTNLIRAGIGMGVINIMMAFADAPWMLLMFRFVFGFFSGFINVSFSYLSKTTPRQYLGESLGFLQTGSVSGSIIGPLIGGLLGQIIGFKAIFVVTGAFILCSLLLVIFYLEPDKPEKTEKREAGAFREVLLNPGLPVLFFATFIVQLAIFSSNSMMTIFVQSIVGNVDNIAFLSGMVTSITGISTVIGSPLLGRLGDRIGQRKIIPVTMFLIGVFFLCQFWTENIYLLYVWRFLQGLILGSVLPAIQTLIKKRSPDHAAGRAFGMNASSQFLGNLIGPLIGGFISSYWDVSYVIAFAGLVLIVGSAIVKSGIALKDSAQRRSSDETGKHSDA